MFTLILSFVVTTTVALTICAFHLSPSQMYFVRGVLRNPLLTSSQRDANVFTHLPELNEWGIFDPDEGEEGGLSPNIQNLLYITHEQWAKKQAFDFKCLHCYKCRDLSLEDLEFSSKIGLMKSMSSFSPSCLEKPQNS